MILKPSRIRKVLASSYFKYHCFERSEVLRGVKRVRVFAASWHR